MVKKETRAITPPTYLKSNTDVVKENDLNSHKNKRKNEFNQFL